MAQSYSPGGANVHLHLTHASLGQSESIPHKHLDQFSHFRTAHGRRSSQWTAHFPLKIALAHGGLDAHLIHASVGPVHSASPSPSQSVQPFLHRSWQRVSILDNGSPLSPSKLSLRMGGSGPHLIDGSLVRQAKRHLGQFSHFCRADDHDRQTDRPQYSLCNNRLHLHT